MGRQWVPRISGAEIVLLLARLRMVRGARHGRPEFPVRVRSDRGSGPQVFLFRNDQTNPEVTYPGPGMSRATGSVDGPGRGGGGFGCSYSDFQAGSRFQHGD